ncbi:hypothetical protein FJ364_01625 [Candidatus Dependentiae bacterium]|nr:hypothetical protein [Candidatus Dependentiae bacterium]
MIRLTHYLTKNTALIPLIALCLSNRISTTPANNYQDPVVFHTVMGSDKFYNPGGKANLSLHLSPFYAHTHTAYTPQGKKASNGNVFGTWNMAGLFLNDNPRPTTQPMSFYTKTKNVLKNLKNQSSTLPYSKDYTNEATFNPDEDAYQAVYYQAVDLKYEKMGLRGQLNFDLGVGLGAAVKGGIANLKSRLPTYTIQKNFGTAAGLLPVDPEAGTSPAPGAQPQALQIYESSLGENARRQLFKELNFDASESNITDLEDLYGNVYWHVPIKIKEKGDHVFSLIPYLSVGASLPMGKDRNQNRLYPVINGNDGYTGLTAEGAIALDFPNMMQLSFGGGITMFNTRDLTNAHVPTSEFQRGIYPWTTSISRQPGAIWYANVSMKADNIASKRDIPNFSCYFDYIYTEHQHDTIKLKEPKATFAQYFRPDLLERDSSWKAQILHGGIKFGLSKNVYMATAVQTIIGGTRVYRPTTLLGSLIMTF